MALWLATILAHNIKFYLVTVHCCYIEKINGLESTLQTLISLALKETPAFSYVLPFVISRIAMSHRIEIPEEMLM
ncbi:hypothetical protein ES332_A11G380300v1 [Gossypium tomentosum]|uniref:Uncharacterized protein n=1 Tax=Gossypium tomentosum TaxID=34277 RepID=A0A5D2NIQ9_GOSTO|nr:hypothetical protein ES332_A11G380300v1 [Gossypium tomentosum]